MYPNLVFPFVRPFLRTFIRPFVRPFIRPLFQVRHSESSKGKREFMKMLYIKRVAVYSIKKADLVKQYACYDSRKGYI